MKRTLTNAEIAKEFALKNPQPIETKTPILIQYWHKKEDVYYFLSNTGEIKVAHQNRWDAYKTIFPNDVIDNERMIRGYTRAANGSKGYYGVYTNYVPEYNMIEISAIFMDGSRGKEGTPKTWDFVSNMKQENNLCRYARNLRLFLFKNDIKLYNQNGEEIHPKLMKKFYNKFFTYYTRELERMIIAPVSPNEFKQFTGLESFRVNQWCDTLDYPYSWDTWYQKSAPRQTSKRQSTINEISAVKLTDINVLEKKYVADYNYITRGNYNNHWKELKVEKKDYFHFEIINENWAVIRCLMRPRLGSYGSATIAEHFTESGRVYINKKGEVTVTNLINNEYRITSADISSILGYYAITEFGNIEEIAKWQPLKWIEDIILETENKEKLYVLIALLRHPVLEKVYKARYKNIFKLLLKEHTVAKTLNNVFGVKERNKGNINQILGCNKYILQWLDNQLKTFMPGPSYQNYNAMRAAKEVIPCLKEIFNLQDLSSWSKESIELYFPPAIALLEHTSWWKYDLQVEGNGYYYRREPENLTLDDQKRSRYQKLLRIGHKDPTFIELYLDVARIYKNLNEQRQPDKEILYNIDNLQDMVRFHDAITALKNQQDAEQRAMWNKQEQERLKLDQEKFEKLQEARIEEYEYSNDEDNFIIKVPHELVEITDEGQKLRHCVGGYLHDHAVGNTNIIFLRRKEMPTIPFYTIEVRHHEVVQIHGFSNCWLGRAPEAVKFVIKWLKKTGIHCDNRILLETANGYGGHGELLDAKEFGLA